MKFLNFYHFLNILSEADAIYVVYSFGISSHFYRYCSSLFFLCGCHQLGISDINYCLCPEIEYLSHIGNMLKELQAIPNWLTPAALMHSISLGLHRKTIRLSSTTKDLLKPFHMQPDIRSAGLVGWKAFKFSSNGNRIKWYFWVNRNV